MKKIEEMIGKTYYRPVPKIDHKNDTKEFVPEEVILTKKGITFYWGNEQCHPSWLEENALVFFETKEECQNQCYKFNYEKGYIKVDENNIHLYYEFMSDEDLLENSLIIVTGSNEINGRFNKVVETLNLTKDSRGSYIDTVIYGFTNGNPEFKQLNVSWGAFVLRYEIFGIKDTLKPLDDYIADIKNSDSYKSYISKKAATNS